MAKIIQGPWGKATNTDKGGVVNPEAPAVTLIQQGDGVVGVTKGGVIAGQMPFPYPSADAVDPRYLKALEEQKKQNG